MKRKHALILYHWCAVWWPCVTGMEHGCNGSGDVTDSVMSHTLGTHLNNTPPTPSPTPIVASDYFILQAFYELTVIKGNNSAVFYWGNKENSEMRSRTKWAVSALQSGRGLPGLQGLRDGFFLLLRIFASLTSTLQPSPLNVCHGYSRSDKSPAITGADLLFITKRLKGQPLRGGGCWKR